jgi:cytochrome c biogenesis protein CcdA
MIEHSLPVLTALWLGVLTSISPCPLAANIAAISFVSYKITLRSLVLVSGILYTLGRSLTYAIIGFLISETVVNIPLFSNFLQRDINQFLGILLIIVGAYLLGLLKLNFGGWGVPQSLQKRLTKLGLSGSLLLGMVFALAFCPVSAALFFGSLVPLTIAFHSSLLLPAVYGVGTGLPVLVFAAIIALGSSFLSVAYEKIAKIENYTRKATGVIFVLVGIYYVLSYTFGII